MRSDRIPRSLEDWVNDIVDRLGRLERRRTIAVVSQGTTAQFNSATSAINTSFKVEGLQAFNTTANRPVWATGAGATADWVYADGSTAYSPS